MGKVNNFYDLDAWKVGHKLVLEVYKMIEDFPSSEKYGVVSQLQRASSSVTANIAEGFARYHYKDKIRFYYQARGSVAEVQNFLLLAKDLNYITINKCKELGGQANSVGKLINGLIKSTEKKLKNN